MSEIKQIKSNTFDNTFIIPTGQVVGEYTNEGGPIFVNVPADFDWDNYKASPSSGYLMYSIPEGKVMGDPEFYFSHNFEGGKDTIGIHQKGMNSLGAENTILVVNELIGGDLSNVNVYGASRNGANATNVAAALCDSSAFKENGGKVNTLSIVSFGQKDDLLIPDRANTLQTLKDNDVKMVCVTDSTSVEDETKTFKEYVAIGGEAIGLNYIGEHNDKCLDLLGKNYGDFVTGKGNLNEGHILGYYTIDANGNLEYHEGLDGISSFTTPSALNNGMSKIDYLGISSFSDTFLQSNYSKTLDYINQLNKEGSNLNIEDCVSQIHSSINTGVLVNGANDAIINYEIGNANMMSKLSNGLESILSVSTALKGLDESLAKDANNPNLDVSKYTISQSYKNYTFSGTIKNFIDTSGVNASDISGTDVAAIRNTFNTMISNDNSYISNMVSQIESFKSSCENFGGYWDTIKGVLDGYSDVFNTKINLNNEVDTNITNCLNKIDSILSGLGHDPATQAEVESMEAQYVSILQTIESLKACLWETKEFCDNWGKSMNCYTVTVKNEAVAQALAAAEAQAQQLKADIDAYKAALVAIREQENLINEEFAKIQKFDGYLKSILPDYPCVELNETGWNNIRSARDLLAPPVLDGDISGDNETGSVGASGGVDNTLSSTKYTDKQQEIIDLCQEIDPTGNGLCAKWVARVYHAAGDAKVTGDACDLYRRYCDTDVSDIQPGMIIAVPVSHYGDANKFGHCGIYVGDGNVVSNVSGQYTSKVETLDLDTWVSRYGSDAMCGYPPDTKGIIESELNNN